MSYKKREKEEPARASSFGLFTNPMAEHAVIEAILQNPARAWNHIVTMDCTEDWFTDRICFQAFRAISSMMTLGKPVDLILASDAISIANHGALGQEFLLSFRDQNTSMAINLTEHLTILRDKYHRRDVCFFLEDAANSIQRDVSVEMVISTMNKQIHEKLMLKSKHTETNAELTQRIIENFEYARSGGSYGVEFPWAGLRFFMNGAIRGKITMVAARPGEGKTTFGNQMAAHCAKRLNEPVGVFSLEMTRQEWVENMVGAELGVEVKAMREGKFSPQQLASFRQGLVDHEKLPLFIDDNTYTCDQLCAVIRQAIVDKGLSLVVIDYLGIIKPDPKHTYKNDQEAVAACSSSLCNLAKECPSTAFVVIHQLNRGSVMDGNKRPELHHLRGSGTLEQDAYMVIFVYQDPNIEGSMPDNAPTCMEVAKCRGGSKGITSVLFEKSKQRFV